MNPNGSYEDDEDKAPDYILALEGNYSNGGVKGHNPDGSIGDGTDRKDNVHWRYR